MRRRNWRVLLTGLVLILAAAGFFVGMQSLAPTSNDPVALMRIVGEVSGALVGLGLIMMVFGAVGRRTTTGSRRASN
jgi:hypothetical protein